MKPDPKEEARRWLLQADNDLEAARSIMGSGFYAQACFLAQQAAEKGLKALVYRQGARYALGHSITELLDGLLERYPQLGEHRDIASRLDQYYITPRYPNALPGVALAPFQVFSQGQAQEAVDGADAILREARKIIKP